MTRVDNTHHLLIAATIRHHDALQRARAAIEQLDRDGQPITFTTVARAGHISRSWLYNQPDLRDTINRLRVRPPSSITLPAAQRASDESLRQRLDAGRAEITRLRTENAALRDQLARTLGQRRTQP